MRIARELNSGQLRINSVKKQVGQPLAETFKFPPTRNSFMSGEVHDECAVAAVSLSKPLKEYPHGASAFYLYQMLLQMQNRGQLSAGITTYFPQRQQLIDTRKKLGAVNEVFSTNFKPKADAIMHRYAGTKGIGHTRYSTSGGDDEGSAQPFERHHGRKWKWFSFAFNGNIANFPELKAELVKKQYHLVRNLDTELILHFLEKAQVGEQKIPLQDVFRGLSERFDGAYNIVYIDAEGRLCAVRDPLGIRPLCFAEEDGFAGAGSESVSMANIVDTPIKPIKPGEMMLSENGSVEVRRYAPSKKSAHCMFEWVYFANAASVIDNVSVYETRWKLGKELARQEKLRASGNDFIVVPVPDTAKPAADSYAHEMGLPAVEGLIRNRYVGRTFIESRERLEKVKQKFNINKEMIKGKKIILVDDSIVRGTTSKSLVEYLRDKGKVKEVHMRITCPPIRSPCFYGIDMSTIGELVANRLSSKAELERASFEDMEESVVDKIAKEIGVDSLHYMDLEGLVKCIGIENGRKDLCMACLTGVYPTEYGQKLRVKALERHTSGLEAKRTYE
ncbi:Glutamine--fructose-6-phosphate aminotransferase [isomerizing] [uncultured archaeon]|nr:Glutamine--fructose-6-phosphate aminotransferase [isomerizing] [uncultured archaeon]